MTACRRDTRKLFRADRSRVSAMFFSLGVRREFSSASSIFQLDRAVRFRSNPIVKKKKKRGRLSRCGKDENSTNQGSACGPRWIGALHFSRHVPLTSAPRHTRFDPRDLPRPRTHTREMTEKNCENCNGAPAAWFCNSDGKPARARAHLCLFFSRHSAFPKQNLSPLGAHRPLTRSPARSAGAYLCTACDVSIHSANKVRRGSTAPRGANSGPSYALRVFFRGRDETPPENAKTDPRDESG